MDLQQLENKLKQINTTTGSAASASASAGSMDDTISNQLSIASSNTHTQNSANVTKKISTLSESDIQNYSGKVIPSWKDLQSIYEGRWQKEKEKFHAHLKANFAALVERFASGKQELFVLSAPERRERLYIEAFLELFESGYAPHVGDVERVANKRVRKLFITLPNNYSSIY